jgi:hypothetical protein
LPTGRSYIALQNQVGVEFADDEDVEGTHEK